MSLFTYNDYQNAVNAAQNKSSGVKIGWFKLADDGDEALVRFNVSNVGDLQFATIHQLGPSTKWMKVGCLDDFGSFEHKCPLCNAANSGNTAVGKAEKHVYIQMLVSYKDRATGQWSAPQPVILDKKASFSKDIATKLANYGDLRNVMFTIVRNGKKGDMKTTYSIDPVLPTNPVIRPELIPADFSAFANFNLEKHSFWVKTAEEINTFLQTGAFPEREYTKNVPSNAEVAQAYAAKQPVNNGFNAYQAPQGAQPAYQAPAYQAPATPAFTGYTAPAAPVQPAAQPNYNYGYQQPTQTIANQAVNSKGEEDYSF